MGGRGGRTGDFLGKPFFGHGVQGFDIAKQKFVGTWVDNFGSYIMMSDGTADAAGKVITTMSSEIDPATGKASATKSVMTLDSDTKHTIAMYKTGADGKDIEIMELVYSKKSRLPLYGARGGQRFFALPGRDDGLGAVDIAFVRRQETAVHLAADGQPLIRRLDENFLGKGPFPRAWSR